MDSLEQLAEDAARKFSGSALRDMAISDPAAFVEAYKPILTDYFREVSIAATAEANKPSDHSGMAKLHGIGIALRLGLTATEARIVGIAFDKDTADLLRYANEVTTLFKNTPGGAISMEDFALLDSYTPENQPSKETENAPVRLHAAEDALREVLSRVDAGRSDKSVGVIAHAHLTKYGCL